MSSDLHLGNKLQKENVLAKYDCFGGIYTFILNPCYDGNVYAYATTKELKKKAFRINSQNLKQTIDFISEIKLKNNIFQQNMTPAFSETCAFILNPC